MMRYARCGSSAEVIVDPVEIRKLAPMPALIEALAIAFRSERTAPPRTIVAVPGAVQLATLYPGNASVGLPTVQAVIVLFSANVRRRLSSMERPSRGCAPVQPRPWRPRYLSRPDSTRMVIIGADISWVS